MKVRRTIILILFFLPSLLIIASVIWHIHTHPGERSIKIAPAQFQNTTSTWTNQSFVSITTNEQFIAQLQKLPIAEDSLNLNDSQSIALHDEVVNLILANYLGDYDSYKKFRMPTMDYQVLPETAQGWKDWFHTLFPQKSVPASFEETDREIWNHNFAGHPYWLTIGLSSIEISVVATNSVPKLFAFGYLTIQKGNCFGGDTDGSISYTNKTGELYSKYNKMILARVGVTVETIDPPKTPRTFSYILALDMDTNIWLPIHLVYCSTKPYNFDPPF
jgi:hypothetical protein